MTSVDHLSISLQNDKLPEDVLKIVGKIRLDWKLDNIQFKVFTDGITNKLIGCYCADKPDDIILVRVFGEKTDLYIDRSAEVQNFKNYEFSWPTNIYHSESAQILTLMTSNGYAPKLYTTFENGMVYDYIPGEVLNAKTCRDRAVYPLVATMLAKMHKLNCEEAILKIPYVWNKSECFLKLIPERYSDPKKHLRFSQYFPGGKSSLRIELQEIKKSLEIVNNPVVFCHNDLLLANVILCNNSVRFIDYEYAGFNYQAFDIANHFAEFAGVSNFDASLYPSEDFQLDWIKVYLKEFENNGCVNEEHVKQLYKDIRRFTPVSHFFWSLWSLVQLHYSVIDFDYLEYAITRYREYKKFENFLNDS